MPHDTTFSNQLFEGRPFDEEIEGCTFSDCDLEEVDLSNLLVVDTTFQDCDMRMIRVDGTRLQGVRFVRCRLSGVAFSDCSDFALGLTLSACDAEFTGFSELKLWGMSFGASVLKGADFIGADLAGADLSGCDLLDATFEGTNLTKTDFRGAVNFAIDPDANRLRGAKFSRGSLDGLLLKHGLVID